MFRVAVILLGLLYWPNSGLTLPSIPTVLAPFTITPSVEVLRSPVTKVETINIQPTYTRLATPSASAVAIAGPITASSGVQRIESYSSGDSSNAEIRDLLRSLLSELRTGKSGSSVTTLSAPFSSGYSSGYQDSYSAPPRNTVTDYNAPSYPDSIARKPEKVVLVREQQTAPIIAEVPQVREVVRTVYQPVYVPVQAQPEVYAVPVQQSVPVVSAVPTRVKTGASAVAISTIHDSPAYAIQQQQAVVPVVQQYQQYQQYAYAPTATVYESYKKK